MASHSVNEQRNKKKTESLFSDIREDLKKITERLLCQILSFENG
jgi:hypothetical protein